MTSAESDQSLPILVVEQGQFLLDTLKPQLPEHSLHMCGSLKEAKRRLVADSYRLIISTVRTATDCDCELLQVSNQHDPFAPFIVTATREEHELVRRAVAGGAIDAFIQPLDEIRIRQAVRALLWLYDLRTIIARRRTNLSAYRDRADESLSSSPSDSVRDAVYQNGVVCEETMRTVEQTVQTFAAQANDLEAEARRRVRDQLKALSV